MAMVDLNGNGYARIYRNEIGEPQMLELLTGNVTMYLKDNLSVYYEVINQYTAQSEIIEGDDIIHVTNFSYDGLMGVSVLTHAANITNLAASADGQAKGYYSNGVNMNGIVTVPGKIAPEKAQDLKNNWKNSVAYNSTTGTGGGVIVLEGGAEFKAIQVNPKDAQMLETRQFNVIDICRFFGVAPTKAFDTSSATYGNVESYQLGFVTDTATPLATRIDNEFNRKLFRPSQRNKYKTQLRVKHLLSSDLDTQSNYYTRMFQLGAYSPNDICREINQPIDPKGDKRYVQVNLAELGKEPAPDQNKNTNVVK
jgi:HK97 family phage portal protein